MKEALSSELSIDPLLEKVSLMCAVTFRADRAVIAIDEAGLVIRASANATGNVTLENTRLQDAGSVPASIFEHVIRSGTIAFIRDTRDTPFNDDPYFSTHSPISVLAAPVDRNGRRFGVLYLESKHGGDAFSEDDVEKFKLVSNDVAVALQNSLSYEMCRRAEFRFRLLADASAALASSLDYEACLKKTGQIVVPAMAEWWAVTLIDGGKLKPVVCTHADPNKLPLVQALHQQYPVDMDSPQAEAVVLRSGKSLLSSPVTNEFLHVGTQDKEYLRMIEALDPASMIAVPLITPERRLGSAVFVRSHSGKPYDAGDLEVAEELARRIAQSLDNALLHRALKHAMQQRLERDRYLNLTFQQLPGTFWTTDRNLRLSYVTGRLVNEAVCPPATGETIFEVLGTPEPTDAAIAHHLAALSGMRQSFKYEFRNRWYSVLIDPLRNDRGEVAGCIGAAFDITEQRTTEERLLRSQAQLAEAQRVAHIGSFEWDITANTVSWSDELHRIYGIDLGQFGGTFEAFFQYIQPDDVDMTRSVVFEALRTAKPFAYNHRIVRPDGSVRMLHTCADVITDEQGKPVRIVGNCWDITEREQASQNLEHARSLLEATIESTADGLLVVDRSGKITTYNQRFLSCWRIPSELAQTGDDDKMLAFVLDQLEDPEGFIRGVRDIYGNPDQESFDVIRLRDGRVFERYSTPQRVSQKVVGRVWSFREVTERERLYRRALFLADATRLLASLDVEPALDSLAHMAVPFLGEECAIDLLGNGGPRRLLVVSRDPSQPIDAELPGAVLTGHSSLYTAGTRSCMAVPLLVKDAVVGVVSFIAPSERRYTPQDLELAEDLASRAALSVENARLYRSAQKALEMRDEFLSIAAHEIRGPITSIHMAVQALRKRKISASANSKVFDIIEREDRRLARFVDELLDLGSIRAGRIRFTFEDVDLAEVVREAANRLAPELSRAGSSLSITSEGRPIGRWDRFRLDQVVTNLLSNAIKFSLGKPITVEIKESNSVTTLMVKDQGVGIPPEMVERIFNPFERAASVRHYGGLGLGLFIVRTIVQGLGGTVRVESRFNAGSTFIVELPRMRK